MRTTDSIPRPRRLQCPHDGLTVARRAGGAPCEREPAENVTLAQHCAGIGPTCCGRLISVCETWHRRVDNMTAPSSA